MPDGGSPAVGIAVAVIANALIGVSFVVLDYSKRAAARAAAAAGSGGSEEDPDPLACLRDPYWWGGTVLMAVGEIGNFVAYMFAPPIVVAPLGVCSILVNTVLAAVFLNDHLSSAEKVAVLDVILGVFLIIVNAPPEKAAQQFTSTVAADGTVVTPGLTFFVVQPGFVLYALAVLALAGWTSLKLADVRPDNPYRQSIVYYVLVCAVFGSFTVICIKGVGLCLQSSALWTSTWYPYATLLLMTLCLLTQLFYLNLALGRFGAARVNPVYFVFFTFFASAGSIVLFDQTEQLFAPEQIMHTATLLIGCFWTSKAVVALNARLEVRESAAADGGAWQEPDHAGRTYNDSMLGGPSTPRQQAVKSSGAPSF